MKRRDPTADSKYICFWLISLFYTPHVACEPGICENQGILSRRFLNCFLAFFLYFLFDSDVVFRFFRRRAAFFTRPLFCGHCVVFTVSVATCTAYRVHLIRTCANLTFKFVYGVGVLQLSCVLFFHSRVIGACIVLWR